MQSNSTSGFVSSYAEGVARLVQSDENDIGLIMESTAANFMKTKNCKLYTVGNLAERYYGLGVKRSGSSASTVKDLSKKILEIHENGELPVLIDKYFGKSKCYKKVHIKELIKSYLIQTYKLMKQNLNSIILFLLPV